MEKKSESEKERSKTWEEEVYWNHFHAMHFCQILPKHFHDHLMLPTKFSDNMKAKMPDKVSLIGPNGSAWKVDLMNVGNLVLVGDGWKDFARTYELEENFLLLFKYKKDSSFEVLIFDGKSLCEKETAYFVKQFSHKNPDLHNNNKSASIDNASTEVMELVDDDDGSEFVSKKPMKDAINRMDLVEAQNNTEDPGACLSDTAAEKDHNDPDFIICNELLENVVEEEGGERSPKCRKRLLSDVAAEVGGKPRVTIACKSKPQAAAENESNEPVFLISNESAENVVEELGGERRSPKTSSKSKPPAAAENERSEPVFVISNESAANVVEELGGEKRSPITQKRLVSDDAATEVGGKQRTPIPCKSPGTSKPRTKKPRGNNTAKKLSQVSVGEPITGGNGERAIFTPDNGERRLVMTPSGSSSRKRGRKVKQATPKSAKKMTLRSVSGGKRVSKEYRSNRRPVTDSEKEEALRLATQRLSESSFVAVMRPSGVYKRFYLTVPAEWMHKHMPRRHQQVVLRMGEKTWLTMFHHYNNRGSSGGLATGWKKFSLDNNLEEFDVCLFNLASEKNDAASVLDVEIFRVIPEIVPPSPVICSLLS